MTVKAASMETMPPETEISPPNETDDGDVKVTNEDTKFALKVKTYGELSEKSARELLVESESSFATESKTIGVAALGTERANTNKDPKDRQEGFKNNVPQPPELDWES